MTLIRHQKNNTNKQGQILGASLIEVALSLPLFMLLILFIVDVSRYFFIYVMLNLAAQRAVDYAAKLPVDINIGVNACSIDAQACTDYRARVEGILKVATDLAERVVARSDSNNETRLISLTHFAPDIYTGQNQLGIGSLVADAGLVRPGERLIRQGGSASDSEALFDHPTRPYGTARFYGPPANGESWALLLENHPLVLHMEALYSPITPGIPELSMQIDQIAYRRSNKFGVAPPPAPTLAAGPTSTRPAPTPTRTFTPTPTPVDCLRDCSNMDTSISDLNTLNRCHACYAAGCGSCVSGCYQVCENVTTGTDPRSECESCNSAVGCNRDCSELEGPPPTPTPNPCGNCNYCRAHAVSCALSQYYCDRESICGSRE